MNTQLHNSIFALSFFTLLFLLIPKSAHAALNPGAKNWVMIQNFDLDLEKGYNDGRTTSYHLEGADNQADGYTYFNINHEKEVVNYCNSGSGYYAVMGNHSVSGNIDANGDVGNFHQSDQDWTGFNIVPYSTFPGEGQGGAYSGGTLYPDTYSTVNNIIKTSYSYLLDRAMQSGITPTVIDANNSRYVEVGVLGEQNASVLDLHTLPPGVYKILPRTGTSSIQLDNFSFSSGPVTLLIAGSVIIPNGNGGGETEPLTIVSAQGDITYTGDGASGSFGINCYQPNLEGIFSADRDFIVRQTDLGQPLIVDGSIIANAARNSGNFINDNYLDPYYTGDRSTNKYWSYEPSVIIRGRPDYYLQFPEYLKTPNFTLQEVTP